MTATSPTMTELDVERFWRDDELAHRDPSGADSPQVPLGIRMSYECVFSELGLPFQIGRLERDDAFAADLARRYNDKAQRIVGRRLLNERQYDTRKRFPHVRSVGELFGCRRVWQSESWWLLEAAETPRELEALLDRVDRLDLRAEMFPDNWDAECRRLYEQFGVRPVIGRHLRGPVTLATSIYGCENLIFLILDAPDLAARFRDTILRVLLEYHRIGDEVSDPQRVRPGFSFADDNCALLTPEMYAFFAQPILMKVFPTAAPAPADRRHQHSDSAMGHLLPLLAETGLNGVNFGPTLTVRQIRQAMPRAIIEGQLAPFTFMRNDEQAIVEEVMRDCAQARPQRGLVLATAASINDGSSLKSMRLIMQTIQNFGRYDT